MALQNGIAKIWDVAVAGEIFADHIFSGFAKWPSPGEEYFTDHYVREAGGGAAITACALAQLGRTVTVFGVLGDQDLWLQQRLRDFGVHLDGVRIGSTATAVSVAISTRDDRSFFTWPGANRDLAAYLAEPTTHDLLAQASHVHLAMPIERKLALSLLPALRACGCTLSLDVGYHPEWLRNPDNWLTCAEVDFFLPNEKEAQIITGTHDPTDLLRQLRAFGIPNIVLKLGRNGAEAMLGGNTFRTPAPVVDAVDTTGAGDAFDAGLLDAFLDRADPSKMLERACRCGSLSTRKPGALNALPTQQEFDEFYG